MDQFYPSASTPQEGEKDMTKVEMLQMVLMLLAFVAIIHGLQASADHGFMSSDWMPAGLLSALALMAYDMPRQIQNLSSGVEDSNRSLHIGR